MKILYLITKSNYGGAQKYVYDLAVFGKSQGHETIVACGGTGEEGASTGRLVELLQDSYVPVVVVKNFLRDMSVFRDIRAFFEVLALLKTERPDILHISSSKAGGIGALAGRIAKVPTIVFTVHGLPANETWRPKWQQFLISLATKLTVSFCHKVICITSAEYQALQESTKATGKIHLIQNGIADFIPHEKARAIKELVPDLPSNTVVIGGIGELNENKNWQLLLHVAKSLPKDVHVCIIGTGEEKEALRILAQQLDIEHRVHFLTCQSGAHLYLSLFDIYVLVSKKEGLPFVLLEAGLAKLPVIATDLPGTRDIVTTGENGLLVELQANAFSVAIQMLLRDKNMRNRLAENLRQVVSKKFSLSRMTEETFALYESTNPNDRDSRTA